MFNVKELINSSDIIDMIYKASGKKWSLGYFNIKKNFKGFPEPIYQANRIYLWNREDITKYIKNYIEK